MKADDVTEKEVMDVLGKFIYAYSKRDMEGVLSLIAPDNDVIVFGLEPDEKRVGLDGIESQLERDWSQTDVLSIELNWVSISAAGPVAWVAAEAFIKVMAGGLHLINSSRITSVLEKRLDKWLIVQGHFSAPCVNPNVKPFLEYS